MAEWDEVIRQVATQVVKIETHDGWGTGFIVYGADNWVRTVATAYHVIEDAFGKPFTISSSRQAFTFGQPGKKDVVTARIGKLDAVTLVLFHRDLPMPTVPLLERHEAPLAVGMEIGWLGFPRIADGLCFFSGRVSAIVDDNHFLVDGTAIHGVSGGPAFCVTENGPRIVGSITAYLPNRVKEGPLPGLSFVTHAAAHRDIDVEATSPGTFSIANRIPSPAKSVPTGHPPES